MSQARPVYSSIYRCLAWDRVPLGEGGRVTEYSDNLVGVRVGLELRVGPARPELGRRGRWGGEEEAAAGHFPRRKRCRIFPRCG